MTAGKVTVSPNDEFVNAPINLVNYGTNPVKQITYTLYDFDTQESSEPQTIDFETPFDNTQQVLIPIKPGKTLGKSDVIFNVTEVDGHPNETSITYTYIERWTVLQAAKKRVVFEDVTGLWCQYCPRGIASWSRWNDFIQTNSSVFQYTMAMLSQQMHIAAYCLQHGVIRTVHSSCAQETKR